MKFSRLCVLFGKFLHQLDEEDLLLHDGEATAGIKYALVSS